MSNKTEIMSKLTSLLAEQLISEDPQASTLQSAFLMLKSCGRCRFKPKQSLLMSRVEDALQNAGISYSKPRVNGGTVISLNYKLIEQAV